MFRRGQKGIFSGILILTLTFLWVISYPDDGDKVEGSYTESKKVTKRLEKAPRISQNSDSQYITDGFKKYNDNEVGKVLTNLPSYRIKKDKNRPLKDSEIINKVYDGSGSANSSEDVVRNPSQLFFNNDILPVDIVSKIRSFSGNNFSEEDVNYLYDYIRKKSENTKYSETDNYWVVDEVFTALRNQENIPGNLISFFDEVVSDKDQDLVVVDYALQHLGHLHEQNVSKCSEIENILWNSLSEQKGTVAGTALIALESARREGRLVGDFDIDSKSLEILNGEYSVESKISALEVLRYHSSVSTQLFKKIDNDPKTPIGMRLKIRGILN